jgi:hydroxymethylbilane synthase
MTLVRIGTRGSRLAVAQSRWVADLLRERVPGVRVELVEIQTSGDRIRDVPLGPHLGQSFFTKEIEEALLDGRVDLAVHSCKDLATTMTPGLRIGAVPAREDPRDALVSLGSGLRALAPGARVATSSPRRKGFLHVIRPDLTVTDIRGNVPTRLRAVTEGRVDAVVLAVAGLARLGLGEVITEILDPDIMLPAASQGALAVQVREGDSRLREMVASLDVPDAHARVNAERACLRTLEAGCQAPVGALADVEGERLAIRAAVVTPDGVVSVREAGPASGPESVGAAAARGLLRLLGLDSLRHALWAGPAPPGPTRGAGEAG